MSPPVKWKYTGSNPVTRAMFVYIPIRGSKYNDLIYIDKHICSEACHMCYARFLCYTRGWNTLRSKDDVGVVFEKNEVDYSVLLYHCCRLVATDYDKIRGKLDERLL